MEYKLRRADVQNNPLVDTLKALSGCMSKFGLPLYVVGATARDLSMRLLKINDSRRRTRDLDVAIAVKDWSMFTDICGVLERNNFRRIGNTQKFIYTGDNGDNDYEVDVVPFGGVEENEMICWPPDGNPVMSVRCFQDIMEASDEIEIENECRVRIAPLCGQFLIKFDAWCDRHQATDKDASDMLFILENYFYSQMVGADRVPLLGNDDMDETTNGALWLASDVSQLLSSEHLQLYIDVIQKELSKEWESDLLYHFMKLHGGEDAEAMEYSLQLWDTILEVFKNELSKRHKS